MLFFETWYYECIGTFVFHHFHIKQSNFHSKYVKKKNLLLFFFFQTNKHTHTWNVWQINKYIVCWRLLLVLFRVYFNFIIDWKESNEKWYFESKYSSKAMTIQYKWTYDTIELNADIRLLKTNQYSITFWIIEIESKKNWFTQRKHVIVSVDWETIEIIIWMNSLIKTVEAKINRNILFLFYNCLAADFNRLMFCSIQWNFVFIYVLVCMVFCVISKPILESYIFPTTKKRRSNNNINDRRNKCFQSMNFTSGSAFRSGILASSSSCSRRWRESASVSKSVSSSSIRTSSSSNRFRSNEFVGIAVNGTGSSNELSNGSIWPVVSPVLINQ